MLSKPNVQTAARLSVCFLLMTLPYSLLATEPVPEGLTEPQGLAVSAIAGAILFYLLRNFGNGKSFSANHPFTAKDEKND
ncbi:MAG: hypothetical protein SF052_15785 [Bacteroidia bacterium]|nr:hypothetical protein [Bacteroidia bacterium]